jgi:hypothetical protein
MIDDPVVDDVHKTRERLLDEYGGMAGLLHHLREIEEELRDRVVTLEPRRPVETGRKIS